MPARSFFVAAYEHLGPLMLWSLLRSLPWLLPALLITYAPASLLSGRALALPAAAALVAALALSPPLTAGAYRYAAAVAAGDAPPWQAGLRGAGRCYLPLLLGDLLQWALVVAAAAGVLALTRAPAGERGFSALAAVAAGVWLVAAARLWQFHFLPLLLAREPRPRAAARLALLLIAAQPGRALLRFGARQILLAVLALSGLGLFFAIGGCLPLQACLAADEGLRRLGRARAPLSP